MALTVGAHDLGTPEAVWAASPRLAACRAMDWGTPARVVVLAPHPDDEVLAFGGTMRWLSRAGSAIAIVAITDGEGSHPRSTTTSGLELSIRRADERSRALALLGLDADVVRLRCPDGAVASSPGLAQRLIPIVRGADWCVSPWEQDGHPDHDATGHAAAAACLAAGVRLARYPVWAWHWATPSSEDLPWSSARRMALSDTDRAAKCTAIRAYRSQLVPLSSAAGDEAILPEAVVTRFERDFELVFV